MPNPVQRLLYVPALATDRAVARQLQFAKAENAVLRHQLIITYATFGISLTAFPRLGGGAILIELIVAIKPGRFIIARCDLLVITCVRW